MCAPASYCAFYVRRVRGGECLHLIIDVPLEWVAEIVDLFHLHRDDAPAAVPHSDAVVAAAKAQR